MKKNICGYFYESVESNLNIKCDTNKVGILHFYWKTEKNYKPILYLDIFYFLFLYFYI